ncbi:TPA: alpha-glucosidase [Streptococcus suis]|uniref:glycoside hydrolase family 13 protein n=1 Tax=Streptococcus suis TaxID=1307 RepID=UPI001552AFD3|nr:alpha-glucosidase [Streptococcus suis]NQL54360.1 alpha-glucosidase [Streptococcus suis]NQM24077.1 alpha-glucosidase [Streptococcus suis]HEM4065815.1 alpha-glucosidase [Streptococcus suis]HEM4273710.1 alpha-glucosidase [Streptococcus suis]HEM5171365.1 alpha-glucosidase [Streptococcus suis]
MSEIQKTDWWKKSVIYQIYPRSFQDSNGDGVGDIRGIISRLDYLHELGIDAIWLSPVYQSPMDDNGYDISDYQGIAPEFGTMEDMEELIAEGHKRNIKIIMDLVLNHTSDEHFWFQEALKGPDNPYYDYYVWADEPNELRSTFSGSAWEYVPHLNKYYLHQFSVKQPDLNWKNPALKQEIWDMINFWIEKGVGGFRLDVIDLIGKEPEKLITADGPTLHPLIQELNEKTFGAYDLVTVGETWSANPENAQLYSHPDRKEFSMIFQFEHVGLDQQEGKEKWDLAPLDPARLHKVLSKWQTELVGKGWNSLFWNNHDLPRAISRFGDDRPAFRELSGKMLAIYLHFMSGTPYIYQGEEIGMINTPITDISQADDIETRRMYAERIENGFTKEELITSINAKGRDNARRPMQWTAEEGAGFSTGQSWLALGDTVKDINVEKALADKQSLFYTYQKLIALRKEYPCMSEGNYEVIETGNPLVMAYRKYDEQDDFIILVNFTSDEQTYEVSSEGYSMFMHNYENGVNLDENVLRPFEAIVLKK